MGFFLDAAWCHVFTVTLHNLLHYLRIVCVTIGVDTFLASYWSAQAITALLLARGSEVQTQTSTHDTNNNTIINPTLTLKLDTEARCMVYKNQQQDEDI